MTNLAELRAKIQKAQTKTNNYDSSSIFSFKNLNPGDQIRIRFVPDGEQNDFFWRPRCTRPLQFNSIKLNNGEIVQNKTYVSVPAFNIKKGDVNLSNLPEDYLYYSNDDVIQQKIKGFWNDTDEGKALYYKFGRTERYVFQGFVRAEGYETKLYRFIINKDLFNTIYSFMDDDEISEMPSDPIHGRDFILKVTEKQASINGKTQKVKDYSTSKWSSNESPLTEEEIAWLKENNPFVLKTFIPAKPTVEQEAIMLELFEASFNDEPYEVNRWFNIFKPDNVFFDDAGNIKDLKTNGEATTTATEIPSTNYSSSNTYNPIRQGEEMFMNQFAESAKVPYKTAPTGDFVDPRVYQTAPTSSYTTTSSSTAPQLIKENTVNVSGDNPKAVINDILSKFQIPQQ